MSTIASPRTGSIVSLPASDVSRRSSIDTVTRSQATSPSRVPQPNQRRNRAALRDYYGLKNAAQTDISSGAPHDDSEVKDSELDKEGFNAEEYVQGILENEGLDGVLRVEGGLVNEIKGLDGERKALVYDNYSKLITATDTIRKMRMNMDPLTPTTSTLSPAIAHIAEISAALSTSIQEHSSQSPLKSLGGSLEAERGGNNAIEAKGDKEKQRQTVRWVLDAPRRIRLMVEEGKDEEAHTEWNEILRLLDKWKAVKGVEQVRKEGQTALTGDSAS
ncbi:MAG: hypothetical protein M1827_001629 [Pycnora praestabilis]|nr:MAG: hypothetical protein M1827_001629 [Pycnora praestabilis]